MKNYLYIIAIFTLCGAITYHYVYTSVLKTKISKLESQSIKQEHKLINCKENNIQLQYLINKQNEKIKNISTQVNSNLLELNAWMSKDDSEKYSKKLLQIFQSKDVEDITKQINGLNFNSDL